MTLETTLRLYWRDPRLRVDHLMAANSSENAYVLLNPESASFIWFPDIYIGKVKKNSISLGLVGIQTKIDCRFSNDAKNTSSKGYVFEKYFKKGL